MGTSVAEELSQVFEIHGDHRELDSHLPILLSSLEPRQGSDDIARELDRSHGFHSGKKRMPARSRLVGHLSVSFSSVTAALFLVPFRPYSILSIRPAPRATLVYDSRSPREDFSLVAQHAELQRIVESLRRQRVRQGDLKPVLEFLIAQADCVAKLGGTASHIVREIRSKALELHRARSFVPKFVVEDLITESIARLEEAQRQ